VLHVNDLHGYGFPREYLGSDLPRERLGSRAGGLFSAATRVRQIREELFARDPRLAADFERTGDDGILFLEAGDTWSGTLDDARSRGRNVVELLVSRFLDVDASCPGNHAFDFGQARWEQLTRRIARHHPVVCANLRATDGRRLPFLSAYTMARVRGVRVGIIGVLTPTALAETLADNVKGLEVIDPVAAIESAVRTLRASAPGERPDLVIVLSHVAFDRKLRRPGHAGPAIEGFALLAAMDDRRAGDDAVVERNVDLVVDGHSHLDLDRAVDSNTWIVQADHYALRLGEVRIPWDPVRRRPAGPPVARRHLLVEDVLPVDREMLSAYRRLARSAEAMNAAASASASPGLAIPILARSDRSQLASPAGNLLIRALLESHRTGASGGAADIALINQSGVREGLYTSRTGALTSGSLHAVCPFANQMETCELTAAVLADVLRRKGIQHTNRMSWAGLRADVIQTGRDAAAPESRQLVRLELDGSGGRGADLLAAGESARVLRVLAPSFLMDRDLAGICRPGSRRRVGATDAQLLERFFARLRERGQVLTPDLVGTIVGEPVRMTIRER
jgi:5'-nucleotidase